VPFVEVALEEKTRCRTPGYGVIKTVRGRQIVTRCRSSRCGVCRGIELSLVKEAILEIGKPERWITLTWVGQDWPVIQRRVNGFASFVRRRARFEAVWTVEPESGGHVNLLVRGRPSQHLLSAAARNQGIGQLYVHPRRFSAKVIDYVFKLAARRPEQYLLLNGDRLTHQTRQFFPAGLRAAKDEVRARRSRPLLTKYSSELCSSSQGEEDLDLLLSLPAPPLVDHLLMGDPVPMSEAELDQLHQLLDPEYRAVREFLDGVFGGLG
jgi:hypothetical protein